MVYTAIANDMRDDIFANSHIASININTLERNVPQN